MAISDIIQLIYTILTGGLLYFSFRTFQTSIKMFKINDRANLTIQPIFEGDTPIFTIKNVGNKCAKNIKIFIKHDFLREQEKLENKKTLDFLESGKYFLCSNCENSFMLQDHGCEKERTYNIEISYFDGYKNIKENYTIILENNRVFMPHKEINNFRKQ